MPLRPTRPIALLVTIAALAIASLACGSEAPSRLAQTPEPQPATPSPTVSGEETDGRLVSPSTTDLAQATVQIWALSLVGDAFEPVWTGSGSIISEDGLVLTNAHVVDNRLGEYDRLAVAVLNRTDEPPEMVYLADVASVDYALDLAVIRIVSDLDASPTVVHLPTVELGDSADVEIGDHIRILGYRAPAPETIVPWPGSAVASPGARAVVGLT